MHCTIITLDIVHFLVYGWYTRRFGVNLYLLLLLLLLLFIFNCSWVDTRWQQYSTHLHTNITSLGKYSRDSAPYPSQHWQYMRNCWRLLHIYKNVLLSVCPYVCGNEISSLPEKGFGLEADNEICHENCSWIYLFSTDQIDGGTTAFTLGTLRTSVENAYEMVDKNVQVLNSIRIWNIGYKFTGFELKTHMNWWTQMYKFWTQTAYEIVDTNI
jgi:hypothetical protein